MRNGYQTIDQLREEAQKALDWYDCKGMKVSQSPPIPREICTWILMKTRPSEPNEIIANAQKVLDKASVAINAGQQLSVIDICGLTGTLYETMNALKEKL